MPLQDRLRLGALALCAAAALALPVLARAAEPASVPEPSGYRTDHYKAPTPATLDGKPALTVAEAHELWIQKKAVFIDVLHHIPKPKGLLPGTIWQDKPRFDIPGSIWLSDTGYGALAPAMEDYFRRGLKAATRGDFAKPLVFYCLRNCWMSWNAAKRAKTFGYTHVFWYSDGTEAWVAAGYPLKEQKPFSLP